MVELSLVVAILGMLAFIVSQTVFTKVRTRSYDVQTLKFVSTLSKEVRLGELWDGVDGAVVLAPGQDDQLLDNSAPIMTALSRWRDAGLLDQMEVRIDVFSSESFMISAGHCGGQRSFTVALGGAVFGEQSKGQAMALEYIAPCPPGSVCITPINRTQGRVQERPICGGN